MNSFQPGDVLGRYRLERKLGEGAMGEVYLARDPHIDRPVAVKTLLLHGVKESEVADRKERMMREARAAGCILHPHVVTLFDAGHHEGHFFLAFEFVEGGDLAKKLEGGPLPVGDALRYTREACLGLGHAHGLGIVHRDIKPSNLMLDGRGKVKISDFGIAKMAGQGTELTVTGTVVGSPHYLSPEQVRDQPLDGRSDLFSLGVVFYEMLTGARPFEGETISTLIYKILDTEAPPLAGLEAGLEPRLPAVLARMLAKDREERFPDAAAVAAELATLERELPPEVLARPARLPKSSTDPTVAISTDEAERPTGADGGAVAGTALRQPGAPETGAEAAAPGSTPPPTAPSAMPGPAPAAPFVPPPPPDRTDAGAGASARSEPAAAQPPHAPPASHPPAAPAADGGTYGVPSLQSRPRVRRTVLLAALLVLVAVSAIFLVSRGDDGPAMEGTQFLAGEEGDLGGAVWPPPSPETGGSEGGDTEAGGTSGAEAGGTEGSGTEGGGTRVPPPERGPGGVPMDSAEISVATHDLAIEGAAPSDPQGSGEAPSGTHTPSPSATPGSDATAARPIRPDATPVRPALDTPGATPATVPETGLRRPSGSLPTPDARLDTGISLTFDVTPPDAFVLVDGTVIGRAAEYGRRRGRSYELPSAGQHRVTLRRDGMEDYHLQIDASGAATSVVRARLTPLSAREIPFHELEQHRVREAIALRVDPPNARVLVDGEPRGLARQYAGGRFRRGEWLELPLGQHRVTLIAPGRKRVDLAVDVTSGAREDRKRIEITLPRDTAP